MGAIRRTPADAAFSMCVRERADWMCERCGSLFPEGPSRRGLDCSHHHGRRHWEIRFDPMNAEALCYGCHSHYGGTQARREDVLTQREQDILYEKMRDTDLGREYKRTKGKGAIAKFYRDQLRKLQERRAQGEVGRLEFEAWI